MDLQLALSIFLPIVFALFGYLIGSIPTSLIISKHYGIDIRKYGSHNAGGTNVGRVIGKRAGILTMALDALKCYLPCLVIFLIVTLCNIPFVPISIMNEICIAATGIGVCLGHTFPLYASFKGGKAVACFGGFVLFISPIIALICFTIFMIVFALSKKVSLSSLIAAPATIIFYLLAFILDLTVCKDPTSFDLGIYFTPTCMIHLTYVSLITAVLIASLVVIRHLSNIKRLAKGSEPDTHFKND